MRWRWLSPVVLLLLLGILVLGRSECGPTERETTPRDGPPSRQSRTPPSAAERDGADSDTAEAVEEAPHADLARALRAGDERAAQNAAAILRRRLRTDLDLRHRAFALLLDPGLPLDLRSALTLVIGTLPGDDVDPLLLETLRRFGEEATVARCALLALGAAREPPEDDEVFALDDRPWGVRGPGGLGVTVRREIPDEALQREIASWLVGPDPTIRAAAATALRHSLDAPRPRQAFLAALVREDSDEIATVLGEALAAWAGRTRDPARRNDVIDALLVRAGDPELEGFRFRIEDDLRAVALDARARSALLRLVESDRPFGQRAFALNVLAGNARKTAPAQASVRRVLGRLLTEDADHAIRDRAARLLRELPPASASIELLARIAREDAAWNVRYSAVETLASFGDRPEIVAAVRAATRDTDERVAIRAAELLELLTSNDR